MILINNLSKKYKENIIFNEASIILKSNINFLIGNNGIGKSTLINIIAGVVKPQSGSIFLDTLKISFTDGRYKKNVGFLLSFPTNPTHFKVMEYIDLVNYIYSINSKSNKNYQEDLIDFFELRKYLDSQISELSVGYLKRLQLLISMLNNPKFYILDEPFSGLDSVFLTLLEKKIINLANQGKVFMIATHQINDSLFNNVNSERFIINNYKINQLL